MKKFRIFVQIINNNEEFNALETKDSQINLI